MIKKKACFIPITRRAYTVILKVWISRKLDEASGKAGFLDIMFSYV